MLTDASTWKHIVQRTLVMQIPSDIMVEQVYMQTWLPGHALLVRQQLRACMRA